VVALLTFLVALVLTGTAAPTPAQAPVDVGLRVAAMPSGAVEVTAKGSPDVARCEFDEPDRECRFVYAVEPGSSLPVTVRAIPGTNQAFLKWSASECGSAPECNVELKPGVEPPQVWALFTPALLEVRIEGDGKVTGANGTINCVSPEPELPAKTDCSEEELATGAPLTLKAEPTGDGLVTWVFGCDPGDDPHAKECHFQPENRAIGVRFGNGTGPEPPFGVTVSLRVSKTGSGTGTVTGGPAQGEGGGKIECGATCTANPAIGFGTRVKLAAEAASGSHFVRWEGAPCSTQTTCALNAGPVTSVRAVFDANPSSPSDPAPSSQPQPSALPQPSSPPAVPAERATAKPLKLQARLLGVTSHRVAGRYGVRVGLEVTKLVNTRLRVTRGGSVLGQRLLLIRKARTTTWVPILPSARPGSAVLLIQLRDRDGQVVTFRRRVDVGR
jgi:hypothetical protein